MRSFWVSKAVRPVKMMTPSTLMVRSTAVLPMKALTRLASRMPQRPMMRKLPMPERSRLVTMPNTLMPPNMPAVTMKA